MGDPTREDKPEPTLELPSLFRRRRRAAVQDEAETEVRREAAPTAGPEPVVEPDPPAAAPPAPIETDQTTPGPRAAAATARPRTRRAPPRSRPRRATRTGPRFPASMAALLTGLVVGLLGAVLTYGGLQGCEFLRGTDSCGGGPGFLLLVGILAVMVLAGGGLLTWLEVSDPRGTSFLGVGITAVVAMLALLETLFTAWMFVVAPVLSAAAYLLAWWVTSRFVEQLDDGPGVDVR